MRPSRLLGDDSGVSAVEFALVAPFLLLLSLGLLELTLIITAQFVLETAVRDTARTAARQAPAPLGALRTAVFDPRLPSFMAPADVSLTATARSPVTGAVASGTGDHGDFVTFRADYLWKPVVPLLAPIYENLPVGELRLSAATTARNE